MSTKDRSATRGDMVTLLYEARGMKGVNEVAAVFDGAQL